MAVGVYIVSFVESCDDISSGGELTAGDSTTGGGFWKKPPKRLSGLGSDTCCSAFLVDVTCTGRDVNGYARTTSSSSSDILGVIMITPAISMLLPILGFRMNKCFSCDHTKEGEFTRFDCVLFLFNPCLHPEFLSFIFSHEW